MDSGSRTPAGHRWLDAASGGILLLLTAVFPWLFAGTVPWSRWVLGGASGLLGLLLAGKHLIRLRKGYAPERWLQPTGPGRWAVRALAVLTVVYLDYLLLSWMNARASLHWGLRGVDLIYQSRGILTWLPTTYDAPATLQAAGVTAALSAVFWSARDWLLGRSRRERHSEGAVFFPPARMRRLLWALCGSSAVLAVVSIAQRLDGTDQMLWALRVPLWNQVRPLVPSAGVHLWGPFPSRSAGAAYFNLVWPVALGFWWSLRLSSLRRSGKNRRLGDDASVMLLPATALMMVCPILAGGRSGALLALALLGGALMLLSAVRWPGGRIRLGLAGTGLALWMLAGAALVLPSAGSRLLETLDDAESGGRGAEVVAGRMASDAGVFGFGAGTFPGLYALHRGSAEDPWYAHASNDWMEFRVTVGLFGMAVLLLLLASLIWTCRSARGLRAPREFLVLLVLSLAGGLLQALLDSPFQVPAVALVFLLLAATASSTAFAGKERIGL